MLDSLKRLIVVYPNLLSPEQTLKFFNVGNFRIGFKSGTWFLFFSSLACGCKMLKSKQNEFFFWMKSSTTFSLIIVLSILQYDRMNFIEWKCNWYITSHVIYLCKTYQAAASNWLMLSFLFLCLFSFNPRCVNVKRTIDRVRPP